MAMIPSPQFHDFVSYSPFKSELELVKSGKSNGMSLLRTVDKNCDPPPNTLGKLPYYKYPCGEVHVPRN